MSEHDDGYIDYFTILGVNPETKPGQVRNEYRKRMKNLVNEIASVEITEERRAVFLLQMAQLNAAYYVLRDMETRAQYIKDREEVIASEKRWRDAVDSPEADALRREFDRRCRDFLSKYVEESMLEAGRDKECVEASGWDAAHERHASRIIRHYRHRLYQQILERLPFTDVTTPEIDYEEREQTVKRILEEACSQ